MQLHPALFAAALTALAAAPAAQFAVPRGTVTFPDGTRVSVEIAATEAARSRGLMFRTSLADNEGMLFVFQQPGIYPFYMKNTLIPLDILWLDANSRIVWIARSVPPCKVDPCPTYGPEDPALYVVEVAAGFTRRHGVKEGDLLRLEGVARRPAS